MSFVCQTMLCIKKLGGCITKRHIRMYICAYRDMRVCKLCMYNTCTPKSFSSELHCKLNLLRSLYFLLTLARADFYFKVILPSVTYGLVVWGSCSKSLIDVLEKIHVHATKTIYNLDWYTPSDQVLARCNWFTINCL